MTTKLIRNSTAEFLIFTGQSGELSIEARYEEDTIWLSQKLIAELFDVDVRTVSEHFKNIFQSAELNEEAVIRKFRITASDGKNYNTQHYNLDAIISVGYRVNSVRATQFRQWATQVLREFCIRGYVIDKERMENGSFLGEDYFELLLEEIREIRLSERRFYQKITDIYATSVDYNKNAPTTQSFFATVQNKLHFAIHGQTAAELIKARADSSKPNMGLIVNAYLDLAESRARRNIPMTMEDWSKRLDMFLEFDDRDILTNAGSISAKIAKDFAESEFEKYRVVQDRLFESDFDKMIKKVESEGSGDK